MIEFLPDELQPTAQAPSDIPASEAPATSEVPAAEAEPEEARSSWIHSVQSAGLK